MLPERGKLERGPNVVSSDLGEVGHDLVTAHARGQVLEHVVHRDPRPNEARLPAAHVRTHIDQRHQIHEVDCSSEDGLGARVSCRLRIPLSARHDVGPGGAYIGCDLRRVRQEGHLARNWTRYLKGCLRVLITVIDECTGSRALDDVRGGGC